MGKKKAPPKQKKSAAPQNDVEPGRWSINSQSAIVTIWESRDEKGTAAYAVTFNEGRNPVPPADDEKGASSVVLAFQKVERADKLKKAARVELD